MAKNEQDPKDENFIKLSDFGLSIIKTGRGLQNMMQDFCGTTGYMSPEILEQKAYSELCDVWAIGIIFYQLLFGQRPFRGANDIDIKEKIINDEPFYESDRIQVNGDAIHLLKAMLTKSPTNRITTALILDHPYLSKKLSKQSKTTLPDYNVLNTMSQWKDEMKVETTNRKSAQDWDNNLFQFQRFD
ncbi:unnamed protein product [Brassicogethes aeneus]|uniref:Protein kinase domain-containing protein n=1 Tax=Brassicogethes aeneus TaxID=1431903 RepID=A0A9P0BBF0_BRAAE|nr:unnamed protein product [Brassicogethes aeneus]